MAQEHRRWDALATPLAILGAAGILVFGMLIAGDRVALAVYRLTEAVNRQTLLDAAQEPR